MAGATKPARAAKNVLGLSDARFVYPLTPMLFAQFQPQNDAEAAGLIMGVVIAGVISGGIPFTVGLCMRQVGLGIGGGIVSAGTGALLGCCGGIPMAIVCTFVIILIAQASNKGEPPSPFAEPLPSEYDDYARAFQIPGREGERRRGDSRRGDSRRGDSRRGESRRGDSRRGDDRDERPRQARPDRDRRREDDDLQRRADEEFFQERGFRPRRRDDGWDD
jgi:hypothetical protein